MQIYGIFGGTFDPVHKGHVSLVEGIQKEIGFTKIFVVPSLSPPMVPIRSTPQADFLHRVAMLRLAFKSLPYSVVDDREKNRQGPSYAVKVLESVRQEIGASVPLCFMMGMDAFKGVPLWHQSEKLLQLAHLVVVNRNDPSLRGGIATEAIQKKSSGATYFAHFTPEAISATQVRKLLTECNGKEQQLLPQAVWKYVRDNGLYGCKFGGG